MNHDTPIQSFLILLIKEKRVMRVCWMILRWGNQN